MSTLQWLLVAILGFTIGGVVLGAFGVGTSRDQPVGGGWLSKTLLVMAVACYLGAAVTTVIFGFVALGRVG